MVLCCIFFESTIHTMARLAGTLMFQALPALQIQSISDASCCFEPLFLLHCIRFMHIRHTMFMFIPTGALQDCSTWSYGPVNILYLFNTLVRICPHHSTIVYHCHACSCSDKQESTCFGLFSLQNHRTLRRTLCRSFKLLRVQGNIMGSSSITEHMYRPSCTRFEKRA
jgi:hypothetical protein